MTSRTLPVSEPVVPVRCRGCGQTMGWGTGQPMVRLYCSELCAVTGPVSLGNEVRNSIIRTLIAMGVPPPRVAEIYGLTRQRVFQILEGG